MLLLSGIIKATCEGYKGSVLIEPEQGIEKADYICGKSFYLDPILDTYKKKIIENPIVDEILEMIAKANTDRLDSGGVGHSPKGIMGKNQKRLICI